MEKSSPSVLILVEMTYEGDADILPGKVDLLCYSADSEDKTQSQKV